jgi:hypothetical protein
MPVVTGSEYTCANQAVCNTPTTAILPEIPNGWGTTTMVVAGVGTKTSVQCPTCVAAAEAAMPYLGT